MDVVVVDAGPLIGLARVGALTVLRHLFCRKEGVDRRRIERRSKTVGYV